MLGSQQDTTTDYVESEDFDRVEFFRTPRIEPASCQAIDIAGDRAF